jgi:hypothetical protein
LCVVGCRPFLEPFPEPNFPFGGGLQIDVRQRITCQYHFGLIRKSVTLPDKWTEPEKSKNERREDIHASALGIDDGFFSGFSDGKSYWMAVLDEIPPRHWLDMGGVIHYLAQVAPYQKPSKTKLWKRALGWLDNVQRIGSATSWDFGEDDIAMLGHLPSEF